MQREGEWWGFDTAIYMRPGERVYAEHNMPDEPILIARDLRKSFGQGAMEAQVIRGISLTFQVGEFTAIIGPSGSGKSTLLYMLGALERPTAGEILIAGRPLSTMTEAQLAQLRNQTLGFVFQFHFLLPEFTARENVAIPLIIRGQVPADVAFRDAERLLHRVGLADKIHSFPKTMSGGQMQRVAVARALINKPQIVFCDEPTGNLDSQSSEQVYYLLRELNQELRQTIVVVTHERTFADRSDRIIELIDGVIARDETRRPPGSHGQATEPATGNSDTP